MKTILSILALAASTFVFAQCCPKVEAKMEKQSCCASKEAKMEKQGCCGSKVSASIGDDAFMAEAHRMMMKAEGKMSCCKSTTTKMIAKGGEGCCNNIKAKAKFKVYANGKYQFFGCKGSATMARNQMVAMGVKAGKIQPVRSRRSIG
ncbi:MAG TPA: hypothetical protein PLH94_06795 [Fimbriimonadaceae bacterium]|nr:hypothetical protein [Fimbriimonadaceae bacterium]